MNVMPRPFRAVWALMLLFLAALSVLAAPPAGAEKNLIRPPGTTRYAPMVRQLQGLLAYDKAHFGRMTLTSIGKSVKGRDLWMVTLRGTAPETSTGTSTVTPPKTLLYLCRQHGHEPASTEGALAFLTEMVKADRGTALAGSLQNVTVSVIPMANPDGADAFRRHNAHDVDLNRDWLRRTQPETRALYQAVLRLHPDLMTDQHELYPSDTQRDFTEAVGSGSGASSAVVDMCSDTENVVQGAMLAEGFPIETNLIMDTRPARLAHRYAGIVAGVPTLLFETNRLRASKRSLAARADAQKQFMQIVLRDLAGDRDALLAEADAWVAAHSRQAPLLASRHLLPPRLARPAAAAPEDTEGAE